MNKKTLFITLSLACSGFVIAKLLEKKQTFTSEELEKIEKYSNYLKEKNFVVVEKNKFKPSSKLNIGELSNYYGIARVIAKVLL